MDDILKRIITLVPDEYGKRVELCRALGYKDGSVFWQWEHGKSKGYLKKLHEIAAFTGVSVAWLKGEDETELRATLDKLSAAELVEVLQVATELLNKKIDRSK